MSELEPLPTALTSGQVRELVNQFRALPNASVEISKLHGVTVAARGKRGTFAVFKAEQKPNGLWIAKAKPGIIKATIKG